MHTTMANVNIKMYETVTVFIFCVDVKLGPSHLSLRRDFLINKFSFFQCYIRLMTIGVISEPNIYKHWTLKMVLWGPKRVCLLDKWTVYKGVGLCYHCI
jgi:hypothetical protein